MQPVWLQSPLFLFVIVEAVTGLAAQTATLDQIFVNIVHIGLYTGLFIFVLHNGKCQIDVGQIVHAEYAHLMIEAVLQSDVNFLGGAVAVLHQISGALGQACNQIVARKAGDLLLLPDRHFAHGLCQLIHSTGSFLRGVGTLNHFHKLHDQCGVIEMHVAKPGGILEAIGKLGRYHVAGVRGNDGSFVRQLFQLAEQLGLNFLHLDDRLDNAINTLDSLFQVAFNVEASLG